MRTKTPRIVLASLFAALVLVCGSAGAQLITEFSTGISAGAGPDGITSGPCGDGNRCLWFTERGLDRIGRITLGGTVTEFTNGISAGAEPFRIAAGSDGNLWFTEIGLSRIGRLDPATGAVTEFGVPDPKVFQVAGIAAGPDGNLWFTASALGGQESIGRIDPTSSAITLFSNGITNGSIPFGITAGPDGNLWFTEYGQGITDAPSKIGRITPGGTVIEYGCAAPCLTPANAVIDINAGPVSITAGADGNLWFTEIKVNRIAKIDPATGNVTEFSDQINFSRGSGEITAGADGNLWFTEYPANRLGRITTGGTVTLFGDPLTLANPLGITAGPDGNVWFAEGFDRIGRITPGSNTPVGNNVEVDLGGGTGAAGGISITFSQVTGLGNTVLTSGSCPALPSGFALGTPPVCDELSTTASYAPPLQVCINYSGISFGAGPIALLHYEGGAWVDVTTTVDTTNQIICGDVNSLSPFVVAEKTGGKPSPTTTAIVSSSNPSAVGEAVTFTATVAGNSPTGTVQFMDGKGMGHRGKSKPGSPLGAPVALSGGVAQLTTSALTRGTHQISAVYSGDAGNEPSTSPPLDQGVKHKEHGK